MEERARQHHGTSPNVAAPDERRRGQSATATTTRESFTRRWLGLLQTLQPRHLIPPRTIRRRNGHEAEPHVDRGGCVGADAGGQIGTVVLDAVDALPPSAGDDVALTRAAIPGVVKADGGPGHLQCRPTLHDPRCGSITAPPIPQRQDEQQAQCSEGCDRQPTSPEFGDGPPPDPSWVRSRRPVSSCGNRPGCSWTSSRISRRTSRARPGGSLRPGWLQRCRSSRPVSSGGGLFSHEGFVDLLAEAVVVPADGHQAGVSNGSATGV